MDLTKLFEMQKVLDARITKEKGLVGQDLLDEKFLALQVELGELANELPEVFKFWSDKKNDYEKALGEYVDCLHFILSIGNELKINDVSVGCDYTADTITETFNRMFEFIVELETVENHGARADLEDEYEYTFNLFVGLGEDLGFTWEQVEAAYRTKNAINHERQANGY